MRWPIPARDDTALHFVQFFVDSTLCIYGTFAILEREKKKLQWWLLWNVKNV